MRRALAALAATAALTAPAGAAWAESLEGRRDEPCGRRAACSDDHGGDGDRERCIALLVAACGAVVVVPIPGQEQPGERNRHGTEEAPQSLLPPDPRALVEAMNTMAKGIGEAAGALAGAIVGGVGGIFL